MLERARAERADVMVFVRIEGYPRGYPGAEKDPDYAKAERAASRALSKALAAAELGDSIRGGEPIHGGTGGYTFSVDERGARWLCAQKQLTRVELNEATVLVPGF